MGITIVRGHNHSVHELPRSRLLRNSEVQQTDVSHRSKNRFYHEFASTCPDELSTTASLGRTPDGSVVAFVAVCYCGPGETGEQVLRPLRTFGGATQRSSPLTSEKVPFWKPGEWRAESTSWKSNKEAALPLYSAFHVIKCDAPIGT